LGLVGGDESKRRQHANDSDAAKPQTTDLDVEARFPELPKKA